MLEHKELQFFLGSNTRNGFIPLFEQLRNPIKGNRMYILKGGPGCGKSTLMRRIGKALENQGHRIEYFTCSSDPNSLDAILDYDSKISIMDGTAPHTMEPKYPGAYDVIINMGDAWNQAELKNNKIRIIELSDMISSCHAMASYCIKAAYTLLETNRVIAASFMNQEALGNALDIITEELDKAQKGQEQKRLLSAVSVGKIFFHENTLISMCPRLFIIPDEWGAAALTLLDALHKYALTIKLEVITCYCSIESPEKIDHLIFPSCGIGITTANRFHTVSSSSGVLLTDLMEVLPAADNAILTGNLETAEKLLQSACKHVERAKLLHDELEAFYITSTDFTKLDALYTKLLEEILESVPL